MTISHRRPPSLRVRSLWAAEARQRQGEPQQGGLQAGNIRQEEQDRGSIGRKLLLRRK